MGQPVQMAGDPMPMAHPDHARATKVTVGIGHRQFAAGLGWKDQLAESHPPPPQKKIKNGLKKLTGSFLWD